MLFVDSFSFADSCERRLQVFYFRIANKVCPGFFWNGCLLLDARDKFASGYRYGQSATSHAVAAIVVIVSGSIHAAASTVCSMIITFSFAPHPPEIGIVKENSQKI